MKRMFVVLLLMFVFITAGFADSDMFTTNITDNTSAWPAINHGYRCFVPSELRSEDEALSNIRSSQGFVLIRGQKPYDIAVDRYSVVFKIQWTEYSSYEENVPTSGGFFIGWDYIPTYSNTVQTYHKSEQKNDALTVQFKDLTAIYYYKNNLCLENGGGVSYIYAENPAQLRTLADSIYSLAIKSGAKVGTEMLFQVSKLSKTQCEKLGIAGGDMVTSIFAIGEADRAGIKEGDVILNINDINAAGGFKPFFASKKHLKILRWEQTGSIINYKNIEIGLKGAK